MSRYTEQSMEWWPRQSQASARVPGEAVSSAMVGIEMNSWMNNLDPTMAGLNPQSPMSAGTGWEALTGFLTHLPKTSEGCKEEHFFFS